MSKRVLLIAGLCLVFILSAVSYGSYSAAAGTCTSISVVWDSATLPADTAPIFSISGPGGLQLNSSSYAPIFPGAISIDRGPSGGALPEGSYTITPAANTGSSRLLRVNGSTNSSVSVTCGANNSLSFDLAYAPSSSGNGVNLQIVPKSSTVKLGASVLVDAQYRGTSSGNWQTITGGAIWSSENAQIASYQGNGHISAEFRGTQLGTTQISAVFNGLTATGTITVVPTNYVPPVVGSPCQGVIVESNVPTNWTIVGPGGIQLQSPNYPQLTSNASLGSAPGGGGLPSGSYTITVPPAVPGGQNPIITAGGFGTLGTTSGSLDCPGIYLHFGIRYAGAAPTASAPLQYVKTLLNMPAFKSDAIQGIAAGAFINNHFVIRGEGCSINKDGGVASFQSGGGGLWSISEDGSAIQERQMCLDGGAASNIIYHHGDDPGIMVVEGPKDFYFTNSTWGACVSGQKPDGTCAVNGAGATKTVHYTFQGDQVVIKSVEDPQAGSVAASSAPTAATIGDYKITAAPKPGGGGAVVVSKNGQQVQSILLPSGGNPVLILASPNGYVAIGAASTDANTQFPGGAPVYLYKIGGAPGGGGNGGVDCTANPLDPSCSFPGGSTTTIDQIPGQNLSITYGTSTNPGPAEILLRFGQVLSISGKIFNVSIFGRNYIADATNGQIVNGAWVPTTPSEFLKVGFANIYGTLDTTTSTLIHAITVRNPIPPQALGATTLRSGIVAGASTSAALEALESLRQILQSLLALVSH